MSASVRQNTATRYLPPIYRAGPDTSRSVSAQCPLSGASRLPAGFTPAPPFDGPRTDLLSRAGAGWIAPSRGCCASGRGQSGPLPAGPGDFPGASPPDLAGGIPSVLSARTAKHWHHGRQTRCSFAWSYSQHGRFWHGKTANRGRGLLRWTRSRGDHPHRPAGPDARKPVRFGRNSQVAMQTGQSLRPRSAPATAARWSRGDG